MISDNQISREVLLRDNLVELEGGRGQSDSPVLLQSACYSPLQCSALLTAAVLARPLLQTLTCSLDLIMLDPAAAAVDLLMLLLACLNGGGSAALTAESIPDCSSSCCRFCVVTILNHHLGKNSQF